MILWLNGTHGVGKTTTARLLQPLVADSHVLDAEKVGEVLMDVRPPLPDHGDFQHWPPWRPLVVETARRLLDHVGGVLLMPMTVLVEGYWREMQEGFAQHGIPVRHLLLHADGPTLRRRIAEDAVMGPSDFRISRVAPYAEAFEGWLGRDAEVVDTTTRSAPEVARAIADSLQR